MSFNGMIGMVSKPNRMTQQACTEPIQKNGRNSRRAREENLGEPVFAQRVVKGGRQCVLLSSTWFSLHRGRTTNVAKAGLKAVRYWCACACAGPQRSRPALFGPAYATPSLEPALMLGPALARPVPPPSRCARKPRGGPKSRLPRDPPTLCSVTEALCVRSTPRSRRGHGAGTGAGPDRRRRLGGRALKSRV